MTSDNKDLVVILSSAISVVLAFFFGQTGVLNRWVGFIFSTKEKDKQLEIDKQKSINEENVLLRGEVENLRNEIYKLEKHIAENTIYLKTLLAWLEKSMPEGTNPFIVEMANEIRKKNNLEKDVK